MAYARQSERCKRVVAPRGNVTPRFCPYCGQRLSGAPVERPGRSLIGQRATSGRAIASLVLGLLSFIPVVGFFDAIAAIALGASAQGRIKDSGGSLGGEGFATAGVVLGILGIMWNVAVCMGFR